MQRALDANPNLAVAIVHRAWYHVVFGRMEEAMADHVRARELDPLNSFAAAWFAGCTGMSGGTTRRPRKP